MHSIMLCKFWSYTVRLRKLTTRHVAVPDPPSAVYKVLIAAEELKWLAAVEVPMNGQTPKLFFRHKFPVL